MENNLVKDLNHYLANVGVEYIKLHNLHWNVVGTNFKSVHEYLETLYDGFADVLDEVAESIKMKGGYPLASIKDYLQVATIEEIDSKDYVIADALKIVYNDLLIIKSQAEAIRVEASKDDDYAVVSMIEGHLGDINKTIWFLDSMAK